jgi:uncharacterized protein
VTKLAGVDRLANDEPIRMPNDQRSLQDFLRSAADSMFHCDERAENVTLDSTGAEGDTALHVFLWRGDDWAAQTLVRHGANVNALGDMGETPLHVAARTADATTIAALLIAGARMDIVSEFGQTPIQVAADVERENIFREAQRQATDRKRVRR